MVVQLDLFSDPYQVHSYDKILVAFSGGKDSLACVLYLLFVLGVPASKIELHHHLVDGRGPWVDSKGVLHEFEHFMDWPITEEYCNSVARELGLPIYYSWKVGGFKGEMLRQDSYTQPICWEEPDGELSMAGGTRGKLATRMMFPQVSPDLKVRWCSAYLKIDVLARLIANSPRFWGKRILVVTGERGQESLPPGKKVGEAEPKGRGCYAIHEPDRSDNRGGKDKRRRLVDHLRPIRDWNEEEVWAIIEKHEIRAHPCYYLGWGRCSCRFCIFGSPSQFASGKLIDPTGFSEIALHEKIFGKTLKRKESITDFAAKGKAYDAARDPDLAALAMGTVYNLEIKMNDWFLPAGACGESSGPS